MKIKAQHDRNGQLYWLAAVRINGRLLLSEGNTYRAALHAAAELLVYHGALTARRRFHNRNSQRLQAPAHQGLFLCPEKLHECSY